MRWVSGCPLLPLLHRAMHATVWSGSLHAAKKHALDLLAPVRVLEHADLCAAWDEYQQHGPSRQDCSMCEIRGGLSLYPEEPSLAPMQSGVCNLKSTPWPSAPVSKKRCWNKND